MCTEIITSDLTVIGGGVAGITAAVSAARLGLKVALVNDRDVLGGNMSSECKVSYGSGATNKSYYARESGIADEIRMRLYHANPRFFPKEDYYLVDDTLLNIVMDEPNISLFLNCSVYDTETEEINGGTIIKNVKGFCSRSQRYYTFESTYFTDASGDGAVAYGSGAEFKEGREAKDEYGESLAPDKTDNMRMGSCILFNVAKSDHEIPFVKPSFAYDYEKDGILAFVNRPETGRELPESFDGMTGLWWLSYGGAGDTIKDTAEIDIELKKLVYGYWDYVKNSGKYTGVENYYLSWVAPFASKRESRRFTGDYVLTQNDIQRCKRHFDDVSTGGWSIDCHDPMGVYGSDKTSLFGCVPAMYNIPYRIMYSKNIKNLFLAGRIVSATHLAIGSLRVMQTLGAMAQAVGTAAYLCKKYSCNPCDITTEHISELQEVLQKNGQYIIGLKENCGFAENARVYASSEKKNENLFIDTGITLENDFCQTIPTKNGKIESFEILAENKSDTECELSYRLYDNPISGGYIPMNFIKGGKIKMMPHSKEWVKININLDKICGNVLYFTVDKTDDAVLYGTLNHITAAPAFEIVGGNPERTEKTAAFRNVLPEENLYSAENVINGISRPVGIPNAWIAETAENESITFEFEKKININEIQLVLNAELQRDCFLPERPVKQLVKEYDVIISLNGKTVATKNVRDNFIPLSRTYYNNVSADKIEFKFKQSCGGKFTEVFAVKIF